MTIVLPVGNSGSPWFGPRVFDDAARCSAKGAITLRNLGVPLGSRPEPLARPSGGAWFATASLLRELARLGPTSAYVVDQHPVNDLVRLAASLLPGESRSVRDFAVAAAEALLDAQASTTSGVFDHYSAFIKMPFGSGQMHAGGAFTFSGPPGQWQLWRLRMTTARPVSDISRGWAIVAAYCLAGHLDHEGQEPLREVEVFEAGAGGRPAERLGRWARPALDAEFTALRNGTLRTMSQDLRVQGGSHCADCTFVGNCPGAPRIEVYSNSFPSSQPSVRSLPQTYERTPTAPAVTSFFHCKVCQAKISPAKRCNAAIPWTPGSASITRGTSPAQK